nr:potassium channel family protein [Priestia megaterium]
MSIRIFKQIYFRLPIFIRLLVVIFLLMFLFGGLIHIVEPTQFPSIFDGVWWAFVTGATVGYGDFVPLTATGKIVAICLILTGGGLIAFYITSLSAATIQHEKDLAQGKLPFKGSNHLILIGWNERTRQLIEIISTSSVHIRMVLIDTTLDHVSFPDYPVHFIQGDPSEDRILEKANIKLAERVLITADITKKERDADNHSILTAVAIRGNNARIPIIVEILSSIQIDNAHRAGATTILRSNDFTSALFYHELSRETKARPFEDIYHILTTQQFHHATLPEELENVSFGEAAAIHRKSQQILVGIIRNSTYYINPTSKFILKKDDVLIGLIPWND